MRAVSRDQRCGCCCCTYDADREFAYTAGAEQALDIAGRRGWTVISMKNDWAMIFSELPS